MNHEKHNTSSDIKFKTLMIRSNLCDYSNAYIHVKATIAVLNTAAAVASVNDTNKNIIFKNCTPFTNCTSEMNNTQVDDAEDFDIVMLMYNLIEYSDVHFKAPGSWWWYYRDEPALDNYNNVIDFPANKNNSILLKFKQ